jgi:FAD/FMN-containing dehydrogenase
MTENGIDGFKGAVFTPEDGGYDDARTLFNAMIDKRPAYVAQCVDAEDVVAALAFARRRGLPISVRSGGHSVAGNSLVDDGLVVDMRNVNAVSVDPDARTATVGGGANWSHFDRAAQPHGLATTGGRVSTTGVAGLTLGGGSGWFERKLGLACDSLISVELVTADGRRVTASEDENPELFWALHGGGGNLGIVTSFEFRLHPLPVVTLALLLFAPDRGPEVVRRYRDFVEEAPDEVGGGALYTTGAPEAFVPEHLQGRLTLAVGVMYAGGEAEALQAAAPLFELSPDGRMVAEMPYAELQCALDDPPGFRNYWSAEHLEEFPDDAVDLFCARAEDMVVPSPSQQIALPWGGAVARNAHDWPISSRHARWTVHPFGLWSDSADDERGKAWARGTCADMKPYATGDVYLNFTGDEGEGRIHAGFGDAYDRLAAVKAEWDPDNVFRQNHNVKPLVEAA